MSLLCDLSSCDFRDHWVTAWLLKIHFLVPVRHSSYFTSELKLCSFWCFLSNKWAEAVKLWCGSFSTTLWQHRAARAEFWSMVLIQHMSSDMSVLFFTLWSSFGLVTGFGLSLVSAAESSREVLKLGPALQLSPSIQLQFRLWLKPRQTQTHWVCLSADAGGCGNEESAEDQIYITGFMEF